MAYVVSRVCVIMSPFYKNEGSPLPLLLQPVFRAVFLNTEAEGERIFGGSVYTYYIDILTKFDQKI